MRLSKIGLLWLALVFIALTSCEKDDESKTITIDFEELSLPVDSFWNGADGSGGFSSNGAFFNNHFTDWGGGMVSWSGFAYSNKTDNTTPGFANQYSSYAGEGANGSVIFLVAFGNDTIVFDQEVEIESIEVTNSTYTALSMLEGDMFSKKFGGEDATDPDWLKITFAGIDENGNHTDELDYYLADYRGESKILVDDWNKVDLSSMGRIKMLTFSLSSSDVGDWGMNTPAYFCLDNLKYVVLE